MQGTPLDTATRWAPRPATTKLEKILSYIRIGGEEGVWIVCGGERVDLGGNNGHPRPPATSYPVPNFAPSPGLCPPGRRCRPEAGCKDDPGSGSRRGIRAVSIRRCRPAPAAGRNSR